MAKEIALAEIVADPSIQIRRSNHEPTIQRYEEAFDKLPPVDVFETPDGFLLADGFHRFAAAERLGNTTIKANVHKGSRQEALEFAVIGNTKNADPLTPEERDDGIRRLKQLHPDWSTRQIADVMSVSHETVRNVFRVDEVKREVLPAAPVNRLTDSHLKQVASAPKEAWAPLAKAADQRGWSRDATALAVRNLKDDRVPEQRKREILEGKADPVVVTPGGEFAVPAEVVGRQIRDMEANDAILAFQRALEHLSKARLFKVEAITDEAEQRLLKTWANELPDDIAFLNEVLGVVSARAKLRVVERK
jgi:ParB-like chromosome segregation protein Spo0J